MKRNDCIIKIKNILFVLAFSIFDLIKFTTILVLLPKEEPDVQDRRIKVKNYKIVQLRPKYKEQFLHEINSLPLICVTGELTRAKIHHLWSHT